MILRRLTEHMKAQNWFAVAIDFLIVVIGVFIGIQVSNWNAARADQQAAAAYLVDIAADVRADITEIARVTGSARTRISASTYLLRQTGRTDLAPAVTISQLRMDDVFAGSESIEIPDVALPEDARSDGLWRDAMGMYAFDTNKSAYDAMIGSGRIELIRQPDIKLALQRYYYLVNALEETQRRTIMPMRVQLLAIGLEHGLSQETRAAEAALFERVGADPALSAAIATSREHAALYLLFCRLIADQARRVLTLLDDAGARP